MIAGGGGVFSIRRPPPRPSPWPAPGPATGMLLTRFVAYGVCRLYIVIRFVPF